MSPPLVQGAALTEVPASFLSFCALNTLPFSFRFSQPFQLYLVALLMLGWVERALCMGSMHSFFKCNFGLEIRVGWFVFPFSVFLSCCSSPTNSCQHPQQRDRQSNQKTNNRQKEIQNVFRETHYFKGESRSPPGAHYYSQWKGGVWESTEWETVFFPSNCSKHHSLRISPHLFHQPMHSGFFFISAPLSLQILADTNPPPGKACFM